MARPKVSYDKPAVPTFQGILGEEAEGLLVPGEEPEQHSLVSLPSEGSDEPFQESKPSLHLVDVSSEEDSKTPEPMEQLLTRVKSPSKHRVRGYTSHMCSEGSDAALVTLERLFQDRCGLHRGVQERFLWNLAMILLADAATSIEDKLVSRLLELGEIEEDRVLYELAELVRDALRR